MTGSALNPTTIIDGREIPLRTHFFREPNLKHFSRELAPQLVDQFGLHEDRPLHIAVGGCSTGEEAWSLAAYLSAEDLPYSITAIDTSSEALTQARRPYSATSAKMSLECAESRLQRFFTVDDEHIQPDEVLKKHVKFLPPTDLRELSLEPARYHTAFLNNVLWFYNENKKEIKDAKRIIGNMAAGLATSGLFISCDIRNVPKRIVRAAGLKADPDLQQHRHSNLTVSPVYRRQASWFGRIATAI